MPRCVQFDEFGSRDGLRIVDMARPWPGRGELVVRVMAAGLNAVDEVAYRDAEAAARLGVTLPSGLGQDFAGFVEEVGDGVSGFTVGEAVFGSAPFRTFADFAVVAADGVVVHKPDALTFEVAGSLATVGMAAVATIASIGPTEDDTVLVSAAAGGIGVLAAQLAVRAGATVVGTAREEHHAYLEGLGIVAVADGDGLIDRVREVLDGGRVTAVIDDGQVIVGTAVELGVPASRIGIAAALGSVAGEAPATDGSAAGNAELAWLAGLLAEDECALPIDAIFPIERVVEAFARREAGNARGAIVLVTD